MFCTVTLTEYDENGHLLVQHDAYGNGGAPGSMNAHQYGFLSRPHDPGADGIGCTVDVRSDGSERFAWVGDDTRATSWLPRCTKGGSAQYGGKLGSALTWREIDGDTGSIIDYVPVAWDGAGTCTEAHKLELGVDGGGDPICQIIHSDGSCLMLFDGAATLADATGGGFVSCKGGKVTISGATKCAGGLDVGGTGGVEVPLHPGLAAAVSTMTTTVSAALGALSTAAGSSIDPALKAAIPTAC